MYFRFPNWRKSWLLQRWKRNSSPSTMHPWKHHSRTWWVVHCAVPCRAAAPSCSPPPLAVRCCLVCDVWCVVCDVGVSESSHSSSSLSRSRVVPRVGVFLLCNYQCGISSSILPVKSTVHVYTHCASSRLHARTRARARVETNARCELHRASFLWTESHPQPFHGRGVLGSCADCGSARAQAIASYCDTRHAWEHA